jgi:cell division transport system permease protein
VLAPHIASALRRTARIAVERPRQALWTMLALTAALFAVGVAGLTALHVERWTHAPRLGASMVVYLGDGVDEAQAHALAAELAKLPGVERAELIAASDSAARLQQSLGADSALLEGVELASLPASVEVTLAPGVRDVIAMSPTVRALRGTPGVDAVIVEDAGAERVVGTLRTVRLVAWSGAALLAGLALIVVLAFIRVRLDRAERELTVMHLLGASSSFIVVPTALAGALQGAVAALIAALALRVGISIYGDGIAAALAGALGSVEIAAPAAPMLAMFVGLGAGLGLVAGGLAGASRAVR